MSQVKEISISYGLTINLGNYESERVDVGATIILFIDEDKDQVADKFMTWAKTKCYQARHAIKNPALASPAMAPTPRSKT